MRKYFIFLPPTEWMINGVQYAGRSFSHVAEHGEE
jgi:hypothetical protein